MYKRQIRTTQLALGDLPGRLKVLFDGISEVVARYHARGVARLSSCEASLHQRWQLAVSFADGSGATIDTRYVLSGATLSLTDKASGATVAELAKETPRDAVIAAALESMGLGAMKVDIDMSEVDAQEKAFPGKVTFDAALRAALDSFAHDGDDPESPLGLVEGYDDPELCCGGSHQAQLMCLMNDASTTLGLIHRGESAENGEEPKDAWIFTLSLDNLSDHGHWAVVDRKGVEATYNYGFN